MFWRIWGTQASRRATSVSPFLKVELVILFRACETERALEDYSAVYMIKMMTFIFLSKVQKSLLSPALHPFPCLLQISLWFGRFLWSARTAPMPCLHEHACPCLHSTCLEEGDKLPCWSDLGGAWGSGPSTDTCGTSNYVPMQKRLHTCVEVGKSCPLEEVWVNLSGHHPLFPGALMVTVPGHEMEKFVWQRHADVSVCKNLVMSEAALAFPSKLFWTVFSLTTEMFEWD